MTILNVRGEATEEVEPDYANLSCSAVARDENAPAAQNAADSTAAAMRAAVADATGVRSLRLSRVSVHEVREWNEEKHTHVLVGWEARIGGTCEVAAQSAGDVAAALVEAGAELGGVTWCLEDTNPAYRRVRKEAVADARRAADDFADALKAAVGDLVSLADPGLLSVGGGMPRTEGMLSVAFDTGGSARGKVNVNLDTEFVTVRAIVEASYSLA